MDALSDLNVIRVADIDVAAAALVVGRRRGGLPPLFGFGDVTADGAFLGAVDIRAVARGFFLVRLNTDARFGVISS